VAASRAEGPPYCAEGSARLLRPRDDDALRAELRVIAKEFVTPAVVFGGPVSEGTLAHSEYDRNTDSPWASVVSSTRSWQAMARGASPYNS
jgi:hypothetical protein